jgi:hypothetical protein
VKSRLQNVTTTIQVVVSVSGAPDLLDPITRRTLIPASVLIHLERSDEREWALVSVQGSRRLKSGSRGFEISSAGWERTSIAPLHRPVVERPQWLSDTLARHLPDGWPPERVGLIARGGTS